MTAVICIVGKNKSNKTKLMEILIWELKNRGLKVGALKHHKHGDFEIDVEGKDTWKYTKAGADTVVISSPVKLALVMNVDDEMEIDEICDKFFTDDDIVLADGFTLSDKPRIIIANSDEDAGIFKREGEVLAVVDEGELGLDDVDVAVVVNKVMSLSKQPP